MLMANIDIIWRRVLLPSLYRTSHKPLTLSPTRVDRRTERQTDRQTDGVRIWTECRQIPLVDRSDVTSDEDWLWTACTVCWATLKCRIFTTWKVVFTKQSLHWLINRYDTVIEADDVTPRAHLLTAVHRPITDSLSITQVVMCLHCPFAG